MPERLCSEHERHEGSESEHPPSLAGTAEAVGVPGLATPQPHEQLPFAAPMLGSSAVTAADPAEKGAFRAALPMSDLGRDPTAPEPSMTTNAASRDEETRRRVGRCSTIRPPEHGKCR